MPRTARIVIENGCHHIITRGNQKQLVFRETEDYGKYLKTLAKYKKLYGLKLYAFCLMPNHVHLILEIENNETLRKTMQGLNLSYSLYFNFKYRKVGHLWQDRFKSKIIQKDGYFLKCIDYVETNPLRAEIVSDLNLYPWNSYCFRLKGDAILDELPYL